MASTDCVGQVVSGSPQKLRTELASAGLWNPEDGDSLGQGDLCIMCVLCYASDVGLPPEVRSSRINVIVFSVAHRLPWRMILKFSFVSFEI